jgi:hypothetical protein
LNTTASEWFEGTVYLYKKSDDGLVYVDSTTTGTDGAYANLSGITCGMRYVLYLVGADGASGDNSYIKSISGANGAATYNKADGSVEINMNSETVLLTLEGSQHATLEVRAYDLDQAAWMYDTSDSIATDYETTGVTFTSSTDNATNMSIDAGADFNVRLDVRAVQTDTEFAADGPNSVYVFVDADIGTWEDMSVDCGNTKELSMSALSDNENDQWNANEYLFQVNKPFEKNPSTECKINGESKTGITSWDCPVITFATKGNYIGTSSSVMELHEAAQDDSSNTAVYTVATATLRTNACS